METRIKTTDANVRILYSEAELATVRAEWEQFQQHFNVDFDFFGLINKVRNQNPGVLVLEREGKVKAIWVGRLEAGTLPVQLGYLKLGSVRVKQLNILNGGIMGDDSEESCRVLLQAALRLM